MTITVFLADDHTVLRNGLQLMLDAEADLQVVGTAADGREAVRWIKQLQPNVAILDIAMPELNGLEAAQQIRQHCPATQVIILSMHHTPEHISRALQAGAWGYLLKESASDDVTEAIRQVHAGRRYLSREISDQVLDYYIDGRQAEAVADPLAGLTPREREILQLMVEGKTTAQISELVSLSPKTVKSYRSRLMQKLGIDDLPGLVKFAIRHGLTSLE